MPKLTAWIFGTACIYIWKLQKSNCITRKLAIQNEWKKDNEEKYSEDACS